MRSAGLRKDFVSNLRGEDLHRRNCSDVRLSGSTLGGGTFEDGLGDDIAATRRRIVATVFTADAHDLGLGATSTEGAAAGRQKGDDEAEEQKWDQLFHE